MRADDPKSWRPCNRPLSPAELMYAINERRKESGLASLFTSRGATAEWPFGDPRVGRREDAARGSEGYEAAEHAGIREVGEG